MNMMNYKNKLDVYSAQIVAQYLESKDDFMNLIQVKKLFQNILDRFRINPIPITEETKNLFQCLDTQQLFKEDSKEIVLDEIEILQYNYDIDLMKVLSMLAIHELEEAVIGDLTQFQIDKTKKEELGHNAVKEILKNLMSGKEIEKLISSISFFRNKAKENQGITRKQNSEFRF